MHSVTDPDLAPSQLLRVFSNFFGPTSKKSPNADAPDLKGLQKRTLSFPNISFTLFEGGFRREFWLAFFTISLAELGDKTQLSTLLMTAESRSPWVVFLGAASALITTSLLGVIVGRWLARYLSPDILQTVTGSILLLISVLLLWDIVHF